MTIRKKLMILLLSITLIPLITIIVIHRTTINIMGDKVTSNIGKQMEKNALYNLERTLEDYDRMLRVNVQLLETLLELQAIDVQRLLAIAGKNTLLPSGNTFGLDTTLEVNEKMLREYIAINAQGRELPFEVDYRRQQFFIVKGVDKRQVTSDLAKLAKMTAKYYRLDQMDADIIFWQSTALENGLHTAYPAGGKLPADYDPRKREWYQIAKNSGQLSWSLPYTDAPTGKPFLTLSMPLYHRNGTFTGVTAIDFHIPAVFQWLKLNPNLSNGAEAFLISRSNEDKKEDLKIFTRMYYENTNRHWDQPLEVESLKSEDSTAFADFKYDILQGHSGVRIMPYKGNKAIWAYKGFSDKVVNPLIIVPYENYAALVNETENFIWNENRDSLRFSAIIIFFVIITVVIVSIFRARAFTKPINELAFASERLSGGNFDSQVSINSGDELQQLGEVFNQIGPKLREHEKMRQSLELAKAIQQRLLPKEAPHVKNFDIAGLCKYSDETGGDYYDFISFDEIEPGKVSVVLGDVTGHGIGAALLMASARSMLRNNARYYAYDLAKILYEFNNQLAMDTDPDKFITLFYGLLDCQKQSLIWALGGHDPAIWIKKDSDQTKELKSVGVPLGFVKDMTFEQAGPIEMQKGDIVVIGTDGIWEAENEREEMFGKERLIEVVKQNNTKQSADICQAVVTAVTDFCQPLPQADDITIVIIKVK